MVADPKFPDQVLTGTSNRKDINHQLIKRLINNCMKKNLLYAVVPALLLVGCTKETAEPEVTTPQVKGTSTIIADFVSDSETRTYVDGSGKYHWSDGDAIGVFNAIPGDNSNSQFSFAGEKTFTGDMAFLGKEGYYAYYPYAQEKVLNEEKLQLTIPSTQNFNFERMNQVTGPVKGSFAAGVAPAVAYAEPADEGNLYMTFHPAASYIVVPVTGRGTVKTLKMTVASGAVLRGTLNIDMTALKGLGENDNLSSASDKVSSDDAAITVTGGNATVTINCGYNGVELDPQEPTYFWFVVAPGQNLMNKTFTLQVNDDDTHKKTVKYVGAKSELGGTNAWTRANGVRVLDSIEWVEGNDLLINDEWDFIVYAYASTHGITAMAETVLDLIDDASKQMKTAVITRDLDFSASNAVIPSDFEENNAIAWLTEVLEDYYQNGEDLGLPAGQGAVCTLGNYGTDATVSNLYTIHGGKEDGKPADIKNLYVKATAATNGIFTGKKIDGKISEVKDVRIYSAKVYNENKPSTATVAPFLTNSSIGTTSTNPNVVNIENVTVYGGTLKTDASFYAIVPTVTATEANADRFFTVASYPTLLKGSAKYVSGDTANNTLRYANQFSVNTDITFDNVTIAKGGHQLLGKLGSTSASANPFDRFNKIAPNSTGYIVTLDKNADVIINGIKAAVIPTEEGATTKLNQAANAWISVKDAQGTSYWTGFVPTAEKSRNKNVVTAEDLAYCTFVKSNSVVSLTNDINLSDLGDNWMAARLNTTNAAKVTVKSVENEDGKVFTISNIKLIPKEGDYSVYDHRSVSMFGAIADFENVKFDNIYVSDKNLQSAKIAGLAMTSKTIKNVIVTNFTVAAFNPVAPIGLFSELPADVTIENVTTNAAVWWGDATAENYKKFVRGVIAGKLYVANGTATYDKITVNSDAKWNIPFGELTVNAIRDARVYELVFTNFVGDASKINTGLVEWNRVGYFEDNWDASFGLTVNGDQSYVNYSDMKAE